MPRTIFKYDVPIADDFDIQLPEGAEVLSVDVQHDLPRVWALVDPALPTKPRAFHLAGTGHPVPDFVAQRYDFVGTFQMHGGDLVFHLFEVGQG